MTAYFHEAIRSQRTAPRDGLVSSLMSAEIDGDRLTDEEVVATCIVTMVGGQETTTNLIGNGVLTLLRHPEALERLRADPSLVPSAVEEMLRYESPSQHTGRLAPDRPRARGQADSQGAGGHGGHGGREPGSRSASPIRTGSTFCRSDNRHLAFGYAAHFCFGAALARIEGQEAFDAILRRLPDLRLEPAGRRCGAPTPGSEG